MDDRTRWASRALLLIALPSLILFAAPRWSTEATGVDAADRRTEVAFGLWFSPWWRHVKVERADGSFSFESGLRVLSWSWALMILGVGALRLRRRLRAGSASKAGPPIEEWP